MNTDEVLGNSRKQKMHSAKYPAIYRVRNQGVRNAADHGHEEVTVVPR